MLTASCGALVQAYKQILDEEVPIPVDALQLLDVVLKSAAVMNPARAHFGAMQAVLCAAASCHVPQYRM